eukprot:2007122-Pleurochrysis_carterae.AAC.1
MSRLARSSPRPWRRLARRASSPCRFDQILQRPAGPPRAEVDLHRSRKPRYHARMSRAAVSKGRAQHHAVACRVAAALTRAPLCWRQDGKTLENELEVVEGMKFDR